MFPTFANAALLFGLAGLSIPVLIHLLLRQKSQRLRFSTIRFFVQKDEPSSRKRKLRNLLLLMARLVLFALVVLAFSRPYIRGGKSDPAARKPQQIVLVVDASASMQAIGSAGSQWALAKALGGQVLSGLQSGDRAALIRCSSQTEVASAFAPPSVAARALGDLRPTFGAGDLAEGLRQALKLLATSDPAFVSSIYILSDLQKTSCQNLTVCPLPQEVSVHVMDLGERYVPNIAVTGLQVEALARSGPHAQITSWSDDTQTGIKTVLKIDGKEFPSASVSLAPGGTTNLSLTVPALAPGWHSVEFGIHSKDGFAADETRFQTVFVPVPLRVLVVETRKPSKVFQEESFFIVTALDPSFGSAEPGLRRFAIEKADANSWVPSLQPMGGRSGFDFVVIPGLKQPSAAEAAALVSYLQTGGGVMLFLGESVSANRYNNEWRELLPARLGNHEGVAENDPAWHLGEYDKAAWVFSAFQQPHSGNLSLAEFTRRFTLTPHAGSSVLAAFDDGMPFILERKVGRGKILLVNTSSDSAWTDWPKHKTFVPWLHTAGYSLAGRSAGQEQALAASFVSGSETDMELGDASAKKEFKLSRFDGKKSAVTSDAEGRIRDVPLEVPGIYSLHESSGREIRRFAVNCPVQESDLAGFAPLDFERQMTRTSEPVHPVQVAGLFADSKQAVESWRYLLFGALALLLIEPLVANRTLA